MKQICDDFQAEVDYLYEVFLGLPQELWSRETGFMKWTPWDVLAHLHFFDLASMSSAEGREAFSKEADRLTALSKQGKSGQMVVRERFQDLSASQLLKAWHATANKLADRFSVLDPSSRTPWFGPDMGARMFLTARFMETWSHSQAIFDLSGVGRMHTDRVKHVAVIGIKTFGWTFANREQEPPGLAPNVQLTAPTEAVWEWNEDNKTDCVRGDAVEFCFVVTQVRNIADTNLQVVGPVAKEWMALAQCFAGPPVDPPAPGSRLPKQ